MQKIAVLQKNAKKICKKIGLEGNRIYFFFKQQNKLKQKKKLLIDIACVHNMKQDDANLTVSKLSEKMPKP